MKKSFLLFITLAFSFCAFANDFFNGDIGRKKIDISETTQPDPHLIDIVEPMAMYSVSTEVIDITFDSNYYSQYTVYLSGPYAEMEYIVTTPTIYLPVAALDEVIEIYIMSDDCGCYYGVLDKIAGSGSME